MINRFRKTATMATALFTVVLAAAAVTKAQGQGAAAPALSDAQAQARLQALLSHPQHGGFQLVFCGRFVRSHLRLYLYHSSVAGETFVRYCRSRMKCSNFGSIGFLQGE